jgi:drug/metabolite transporter (DMT)-like permease
MGLGQRMREWLVTPDAVYGLILFSALIGAVDDEDSDTLEVLLVSVASLVIFWGAHVFAGTIASHGADTKLGSAFGRAVSHSSGMLYAAILPTLVLLLGVFHVVSADDAVSIALLVATLVLGVLGYSAFAQRRRHVVIRILGGIGTALFGLLMIVLNIVIH